MDNQQPGTGTPPENEQPTNNAGGEVERLRKEAEQAKMRANQLANELEERKKADDAAKEAKLKENEEFKALYEQEQAKRTEIETKFQAERKAQEVKAATEELDKNYSKDVLELATAAGVALTDTSDEAKAAYKERLDALTGKVKPSGSPVRGSNPAPTPRPVAQVSDGLNAMRVGSGTGNQELLARGVHEVLKDNPALESMRQAAGYTRPQ
jgi:membrane protein involved in colicin uptake